MFLQNPFFLVSGLTGGIFLLAGALQARFPPQRINGLYGYRTARSMRSQSHWDFAQHFSAREMMRVGSFLVLAGIAGLWLAPDGAHGATGGIILLVLGVVWMVVRVERALGRHVGDD